MARKDSRKRQNEKGLRGPKRGTPYRSTDDPARREKWLRAFRESGGSYAAACRATGDHLSGDSVNPPGYSSWRSLELRDPAWASLVAETKQMVLDDLEAEAYRRAVIGVEQPVHQKATRVMEPVFDDDGQPVRDKNGEPIMRPASVRRFSDALLIKTLASKHPDFADKKTVDINHNVNRGGAWTIGADDLAALDSRPDLLNAIQEAMALVRAHRKGAAQIEHKPREVLDAEFETVEDDAWDSEDEPIAY